MELNLENIEKVLDERVRPDLALHGGNIMVTELKGDALYVRLLGACSGCLSADTTMETLVESELKEAFSQLKSVTLITGVSDQLLEEARRLLKERHGKENK